MTTRSVRGPALAPFEDTTLSAMFLRAAERFATLPALRRATVAGGLTYADAAHRVGLIVALLRDHGVARGDRVALLSENRPEWVLADRAVLCLGAVTVPVYPNLPVAHVAEILRDSGAKLAFASTAAQAARVRDAAPSLTTIVLDDLDAALARVAGPPPDWRAHARAVAPDDLATLIYTSGTTGTPKGVMLTHRNVASDIAATDQHGSVAAAPGEVMVSILPLSHALERAASYYYWSKGVTTVYAESMQTVARDIAAERPHHLVIVPRLLDKIHEAVVTAEGVKGRIGRWAARVAVPVAVAQTWGVALGPVRRGQLALADRLVFRVIRQKLGGRLHTVICGGASLAPDVASLFLAAGVPVFEGYGLTETSPVLSANRPGYVRIGSVGVPYPGVEIRVGDDREIQVRGPMVMQGYWQRPTETLQAFTEDGWFRTGDIGRLDTDGFVFITDRLKDLIVTSGGKNIAPQPIEQRVAASPLIAQAVLLGDRRPYPVMLVVPDYAAVEQWARRRGGRAASLVGDRQALIADAEVQEALRHEVDTHVTEFAPVERPKRVAVVPDEFSVENTLLTPTLKVRRRVVEERYAALLATLYAP
jgi:long-chain acyl-CoA synthetase